MAWQWYDQINTLLMSQYQQKQRVINSAKAKVSHFYKIEAIYDCPKTNVTEDAAT